MKILLSTKRFLPILGGTVNYTLMFAAAFQRGGAEVIIMTRTSGDNAPPQGCSLVREPCIKEQIELAKWADVLLQVDASWQDAWPFILRRVPWFPTIHCGKIHYSSLRHKLAQVGLSVAYHLGRTIPISEFVAKDWHITSPPIHNPYDDAVFREPEADAARTIDLLFVGRIETSKGIFVLIEALKQIAPQLNTPPRCCFVGDGPQDDLLRQATAAFSESVKFEHTGRLRPQAVAKRMQESKILVFPTTPEWVEASPLTPLEALACGCRIIAADSGGTCENIGPDGVLIPSGHVTALSSAILKLLRAPPVRDKVAIQRFLADRTIDRIAARYLDRFAANLR